MLDFTDIKSVSINSEEMKSLSLNGEQIWSGVPDLMYFLRNGIFVDVGDGNSFYELSYTRPSGVSQGTITYNAAENAMQAFGWALMGGNAIERHRTAHPFSIDDFSKIHLLMKGQAENQPATGITCDFVIGGKTENLAITDTYTEYVVDISSISHEGIIFGCDFSCHRGSNGGFNVYIKDIWFTSD